MARGSGDPVEGRNTTPCAARAALFRGLPRTGNSPWRKRARGRRVVSRRAPHLCRCPRRALERNCARGEAAAAPLARKCWGGGGREQGGARRGARSRARARAMGRPPPSKRLGRGGGRPGVLLVSELCERWRHRLGCVCKKKPEPTSPRRPGGWSPKDLAGIGCRDLGFGRESVQPLRRSLNLQRLADVAADFPPPPFQQPRLRGRTPVSDVLGNPPPLLSDSRTRLSSDLETLVDPHSSDFLPKPSSRDAPGMAPGLGFVGPATSAGLSPPLFEHTEHLRGPGRCAGPPSEQLGCFWAGSGKHIN